MWWGKGAEDTCTSRLSKLTGVLKVVPLHVQ